MVTLMANSDIGLPYQHIKYNQMAMDLLFNNRWPKMVLFTDRSSQKWYCLLIEVTKNGIVYW